MLYEIRVHGVLGTPPSAMLQVPNVVRVAGDGAAGFYQPATFSTAQPDPQPDTTVEAYSWSGLTSGGRWRALWLLLLPFMLVNVAYYSATRPLSERGQGRRLQAMVLRLLALSLTITFVLSVVSVSMDLVAWQYLRPGRDVTQPLLKCMRWRWLNHPQRQLALTAAVPLAAVGLLWWLADQTWARTERTAVPSGAAVPTGMDAPHDIPLADPAMFNGRGPVRKLRAVHVTGGFAVVAGMLLLPEWHGGVSAHATGRGGLLGVLSALVLALLVLVAGLSCLPAMTDRPHPRTAPPPREVDVYTFLPWLGLALAVGVGAFVWFSSAFREAWPGSATRGDLSGYADVVVWLFAVQVVLLLVSAALSSRQRAGDGAAWGGFTPTGLAATGWLIGGGFGAALMLAVARILGSPTAASRVNSPRDLIVPTSYLWTSAAALGTALLLVPALAWLVWRWRTGSAPLRDAVARAYDRPLDAGRTTTIARQWSRAGMTDLLLPLAGALLAAVLALVVASAVGYGISHEWIVDQLSWAVTLGVVALAGLAVVLIQIGRRAYSNENQRRTIGVLWDLGTFWPRAVHPLAPPCYSERTVPDLIRRVDFRRADAPVVLSCHSQGTVIGAAAVLQLGSAAGVGLVTYGSPLRRLYTPMFPAYLGPDALRRVDTVMAGRWRNLYRSSDPIGGYVFADRFGRPGPSADIDWWLLDPVYDIPPGDGTWPPTRGHGDYFADPAYEQACAEVVGRDS